MEKVLRYISDHIREPLTLHGVAEYAGYSVWHFCSKFKRYTGATFLEYLRSRRMQLAARDLMQGMSVTEVAMQCGYDSVSGFERAFLKSYRCSPSAFVRDACKYQRMYEERRKNMLTLSNRCAILEEEIVYRQQRDDMLIGQYRYHADMGLAAHMSCKDRGVLHAKRLSAVIRGYKPIIFDGELIVGNNFGNDNIMKVEEHLFTGDTAPGKPGWKEKARAYLQRGLLTPDEIDELISLREEAGVDFPWLLTYCEDVLPEERALFDEQAAEGHCIAYNHTVLGYEQVVKYGFSGLLERVRSARAAKGALTEKETAFYDGMEEILTAACGMGRRFAEEAERLAVGADEERRSELLQIAAVCRRVPEFPAETFQEACQSLWFAHIINTWEDGVNANSIGRIDQILYPCYRRDVDEGRLNREQAFEMICCLFLKLYRDYDVQQSTIGGCDREGKCAVNDLSYLMLDAIEALDFVRCMSVRVSADMPRDFLKRALEVVSHVQKGVPFFFSDDVLIDALVDRGIPIEDARDYAPIGCVEITIPGKCNAHAVTGSVNMLKALEYALGNGESLLNPGVMTSIQTGDPAEFESFDDLKAAVIEQFHHLLDVACGQINRAIPLEAENAGMLYKSILSEGCMESGRHYNEGGPLYNYYQVMLMGIPNLADSLEAIRHFVYEQKRYTLPEVVEILKADFPDEAVRQEFINHAAKFGNDQPRVDELAAEMMGNACDYMATIPSVYGQGFHAQPFTFLWMHDKGRLSAASADGRRSGEILAYSVSPMQGRDFNGLTAVFNSLTRLPARKAPATTSAIVEVDPYLFSDKNIDMMTSITLAAISKGLANVQFNTISRETLIDAQKHPEKHRNLAVRVSGFSQKFVLLDKKMQEHIINRTKHTTL